VNGKVGGLPRELQSQYERGKISCRRLEWEGGAVSSRVALLLRSAEAQPYLPRFVWYIQTSFFYQSRMLDRDFAGGLARASESLEIQPASERLEFLKGASLGFSSFRVFQRRASWSFRVFEFSSFPKASVLEFSSFRVFEFLKGERLGVLEFSRFRGFASPPAKAIPFEIQVFTQPPRYIVPVPPSACKVDRSP
jgi:hypothetical protein